MPCLNLAGYTARVATGGVELDAKALAAPCGFQSELEPVVCSGYREAALGAAHSATLHEVAERELVEPAACVHSHMLMQRDLQIEMKGGGLDWIAEFPIAMAERLVTEEIAHVVCLVVTGFLKHLDCELDCLERLIHHAAQLRNEFALQHLQLSNHAHGFLDSLVLANVASPRHHGARGFARRDQLG
jgi:hypothetical protein